ncbi:tetratricopeptide repeat protein 14-like [Lingula anatina]|uniref:Tetratricopeptide repeat protein 14-like n=1 Tax=Lingula anatina TaxID=7574 RepID=A0A1S3I1T0_LINAN|nr:tetratricopeptide repeat protein 14-like [Lingula anatina]|eukprot:XP_013392203.1 tetratricopeptide repeat protein 14-like [Lingula anatina]
MDPNLIQRVVDYHGNELLDLLESDQTLSSFPVPSAIEYRPPEGDPNDEEFRCKLNHFLSRKSDLLYTPSLPPVVEIVKNEKAVEDYYAVMPPLEAFMGVSPSQCRKHFYQCAQKNDIFVGVVTAVQESGLIITLLALDYGKARDIDQLRITGFCPLREVPRLYAHESPLDAFTIKDKVRGIILQVDPDKEKIVVSLQVSALPPGVENLKIGLIADEEMPVHYQ